ncbi:TetR/AcrR family transcriptional regulator [Mesobacillus harenae]|uniref:TetR/AcrR family transcriptional regulator n=1 Tax=Mesobacillus harenae TaxID=2213203 RepID=UPI001580E60E|nr:TetR/AcrR family transcriptional regulator [Mesobacillus harenae]
MDTKSKIREVALKLFADKGYEQTSLSTIASEVGIKTPSIYAFFKSKEDLFLTISEEVFIHHYEYIRMVSDDLNNETAERKLLTILEEMYNYHLKEETKTNFYRRFMMFSPEGLDGPIKEAFIKSDVLLSSILSEIFTQAIEQNEVRPLEADKLINSYLCLMDGLFLQLFYYSKEPEALERRLRSNWEIYWAGIKKEASVQLKELF